MAQLVLNMIDSYHDIMDNKSGEYLFLYPLFHVIYTYSFDSVLTFDSNIFCMYITGYVENLNLCLCIPAKQA